ncbi:2-oxoglutarate (2OG) and Fe(II)-dependent oxygenase superfamily protein [Quillaja saponaria]|uniref:2-oxoglutarate (2OG) and Fe(II)-dependent oxygenase superfamily protein n=1 Tax=Quillaja saponaria TaxID=32244 RepID=A0AAD7VKL8_QUISA|nr:2-oxoglutarate (2OG) and Fe(II)-dependent oxygenase superfamily protein [Quillaja saponaria]
MEPKPTNLGSSLLVPSVQELAKETLSTVPSRYVRLDQEPPIISKITSLPEVPVIDLTKLFSEDFKEFELEDVALCLQKLGFLPDYKSWSQSIIGGESEDRYVVLDHPPSSYKETPFIPPTPPPIQQNPLAESLKIDDNYIKDLFEEGLQMMRMNYYPPCPQPDLVIDLNPHSDVVGLTILLQVNEIEGLQIRKDGIWIPVKALPNAFIVNIGEILEIMTNGIYQSIEHRATVNSEKERLSVATFYSPKVDGNIGPAPSLITPERPALFKRIGVEDYFKGFLSRELSGKSYVDVLRIKDEDVKKHLNITCAFAGL